MKKVIIVGAGIGGLTTAIRLLKKGFDVTIIEKEFNVGGKVNIHGNADFKFDLTASIMMTADIYLEVFKDFKEENLELINLEPMYNVYYYDGTNYKFYSDIVKMKNQLAKLDIKLPTQYEKFLINTLKNYEICKEKFLDKPMINLNEIIDVEKFIKVFDMKINKNCYEYISEFIDNEKFKEYLLFKAMYMGVNPYESSSIYTLIPAISHGFGLHHIKGGMYKYILELEKYINLLGGKIQKDTTVEKIITSENKVTGVATDKEIYYGDIVVCNADFPYAIENLFENKFKEGQYNKNNIEDKKYSYSVFMIYLGLRKKYNNLAVHNIYINKDLRKSLKESAEGKLPLNPSTYIYYPTSVDESFCENGKSVMNIMVRVPNLEHHIKWDSKLIKEFRNKVIDCIKNIEGLEDIEKFIEYEDYLTPLDLQNRFNAYKGSSFGLSHSLNQSLYLRPHIKSKEINGLYYIGSSTHPGNGVSIIISGTKVLADLIEKDSKNY